jgi:zinc protease
MRLVRNRTTAAAFALAALGCSTPALAPAVAPESPPPAPESAAPAAAPAAEAAPPQKAPDPDALVADPALVTGELPNGLRYIVLHHGEPAGRISIWLHVGSGSLNETEEQRGIAHFLEHMAFNGSENFAPGTLVPYFQSLGLAFGRDQNAFTNYGETTFQLALPDVKDETVGKAMLFLSDVASRLTLLPKEIDDERQIILEEKRARGGAATRVRDYVNERLAPESTFGRRSPIGVEEQIRKFTQADFRDYYSHWYVPADMTVIAAGDTDPAAVVEQIRANFSSAPAAPKPQARPVGAAPTKGRRAIVATDPEITSCSISMTRVAPPEPPTFTFSGLRHDLVALMAVRAYGRRAQRATAAGRASFLESDCGVSSVADAFTLYRASCRAVPRQWKKNLTDFGTMVQRARLHGFTDREIEDVRTAWLAEADEAASREPTAPVRELLTRINSDVGHGEPALSAAQRRDAARRLLPGITAAEVSAAFAEMFDPSNVVFVLEIPSGDSPPTDKEFLGLCAAALDVTPDAEAEAARPTALLAAPPKPGEIAESSVHATSGVASAWLGNGVRVHHRSMPERANEATVAITFAAGSIQETAADRGISDAALLAWKRPAGGSLTGEQVKDLMTGKKVHVSASSTEDTMTLSVTGEPSDLEEGMKLAYLLLTEPVVEPRVLGAWKQNQKQSIEARRMQPAGLLTDTVDDAFFPKSEARKHAPEYDDVRRITSDAATARIREIASKAPAEVAVVGDIDRDTAMALVAKYVGSLPTRPRIDTKTLAALRNIPRPAGPVRVERTIDVKTPEAIVLDGFFGADSVNKRDSRLLEIAARVLSTRMVTTIREEKQLVYSIRAASRPAVVYPGLGMFAAQAPTDPAKGGELAAALEEMYAAFAKDGPTEDEMTVAKKQLTNQIDEAMKTPVLWTGMLATLDYRGGDIDDAVAAPDAIGKFTADEVRETFAKYFRPEARFHFVVTPKDGGTK